MRMLTDAERAERCKAVAAMTRRGMTAPEIAEALGTTARTVQRYRSAAGVAKPLPKRLTAAQLDFARQLLDDGSSFKEVARSIGCDPATISYWFPGRGWTATQSGAWCAWLRKHEAA